MLRNLVTRFRASSTPKPSIAEGRRLYVVGDIHGRLDLLDQLLTIIDTDDSAREATETHLIFLGDLIDRGPHSAQVVERLRQLAAAAPGATRFLLGNHEEVFLAAVAGNEEAFRFFIRIGGRETVLSYGVSEEEYRQLDYPELLAAFRAKVPPDHVDFIQGFENLILDGDYAFVHAGIRPNVPLVEQREKDLRWIREEFLSARTPHEKVIVHGHTISTEPELLPHRIGLDTGAYVSGTLTAMGFEGSERWPLQASVRTAS